MVYNSSTYEIVYTFGKSIAKPHNLWERLSQTTQPFPKVAPNLEKKVMLNFFKVVAILFLKVFWRNLSQRLFSKVVLKVLLARNQ
jgi:hypothetical protein